jgi:hypothetical protein
MPVARRRASSLLTSLASPTFLSTDEVWIHCPCRLQGGEHEGVMCDNSSSGAAWRKLSSSTSARWCNNRWGACRLRPASSLAKIWILECSIRFWRCQSRRLRAARDSADRPQIERSRLPPIPEMDGHLKRLSGWIWALLTASIAANSPDVSAQAPPALMAVTQAHA